ncbi:DNA-protecting protein DprA, partial [Escherichia coli]|nr:DNA-protecting protein DprA [Escherichia coli]
MTSTEIWLRLIDIGELYGERMVLLAQRLQQEGHIDTAMLLTLGLTKKQTEKFFACAPHVIESSLRWLDEPDHHLAVS